MRFVLPKKVRVGKKHYTVNKTALHSRFLGEMDAAKRRISINSTKKLAISEMSDVFWHEITHCILNDMRSPLNHNERFVDAFGKRLAQVYRSMRA